MGYILNYTKIDFSLKQSLYAVFALSPCIKNVHRFFCLHSVLECLPHLVFGFFGNSLKNDIAAIPYMIDGKCPVRQLETSINLSSMGSCSC